MVIFHSYVSLPEGKLHSISRNKNKVEDARAASPDADKVLAGWKHIDPLFTPKMDPYVGCMYGGPTVWRMLKTCGSHLHNPIWPIEIWLIFFEVLTSENKLAIEIHVFQTKEQLL